MSALIDPTVALPEEAVLGGKGAALHRLFKAGLPVPPFRVLDAAAPVPSGDELLAAAKEIAVAGGTVIVRSSAEAEDGRTSAMAGRFVSVTGVAPDDEGALSRAFAEVRASGEADAGRMAVVLQREISPEFAGVAFTVDPTTGRRDLAVVSAVAGHGEALVSGELTGRSWRVDREGGVDAGEGDVLDFPVSLVAEVASLARDVYSRIGLPQDIEWAYADKNLYLVQARPVTTIAGMPDPAGVLRIWERSNIAESYAGVTTAATFAFIRQAYAPVYRTFCQRMGVSPSRIRDAHAIFEGLLGFHQGRVTYNLLAWHALVKLLPGYRFNGPFMEQMMGVSEQLPDDAIAWIDDALPARPGALTEAVDLCRATFGWLTAACRFATMRQRFLGRVDGALEDLPGPVSQLSGDEIVGHYRMLEQRLLQNWDAPIVNDLFCMISFGVLRACCVKWSGREELAAELVRGAHDSNVISIEPALAVRDMAQTVRELATSDEQLSRILATGDADEVVRCVQAHEALNRKQQAYLSRFGDRCLGELKLENPSLKQDPLPLWRQVAATARATTPVTAPVSGGDSDVSLPGGWRGRALRALGRLAARRLADRELLRYERTRVFGRVRDLLSQLGRILWSEGKLDDPSMVFHLEIHELMGAVDGTCATMDLAGLAAVRHAEYQRNLAVTDAPERFESRGPAHLVNVHVPATQNEEANVDGDSRDGIGCSPGKQAGRVRLVEDPSELTYRPLEPGDILVCRRTDPGWAIVLASCAAVVVEHGSMLSHAAIVARELNLPAVVGIPNLMHWLRDGDEVTIDGVAGKVVRTRSADS